MAAEKGSAFLLKIGNGGEPPVYAAVAGMRTTQLSVNGEPVNVTTKDSGGWRELLSAPGFDRCRRRPAASSPDRRRSSG